MRYTLIVRIFVITTLFSGFSLYGQSFVPPIQPIESSLINLRIPGKEIAGYKTRVGDDLQYSNIQTFLLEDGSGYRFQITTNNQVRQLYVQTQGFFPYAEEIEVRSKNFSYTRNTKLNRIPKLQNEEVLVLSLENLPVILRAYPFLNPQTLTLLIVNSDDNEADNDESNFAIQFEFRGIEDITIDSKTYSAYKLELVFQLPGIASIFSGFLPKTYFWYETNPPHILLRYQGPDSFNFGETFVTELYHYRIQ